LCGLFAFSRLQNRRTWRCVPATAAKRIRPSAWREFKDGGRKASVIDRKREGVNVDEDLDLNAVFSAEDKALLADLVTDAAKESKTTLPAEDNPTETTAPSDTPAPNASATEPVAQHGDTRAALRAARASERRLRDALAAKDAEIQALREGKAPVNTEISEDELTQMEQDFPAQAALVKSQRRMEQELAELRATVKPVEWQPPSYAPEVQEHIDAVPDLLAWQHDQAQQDKFAAAIEHDKLLETDVDWREKPIAERFAEAARRAKKQFAPAPAAPPAPKTDTASVLARAPMVQPKGVSDFHGGGPAQPPAPDYSRMTDEQIMATIKPEGY